MKKDKKTNIILLTIRIALCFIIFDQILKYIPSYTYKMIINSKYGAEVIVEAIALVLIIIVLVIFKNTYIFKEKRTNFFKSLLVGLFPLGIATLLLVMNFNNIFKATLPNIITTIIYCILIGLFEEFLCRGWVQNEFIEKYCKNRKQLIISILLSSFIFGIMHISNIWIGGQQVFETIAQVIQATGMGFLLGAIYYRTKNIWSVAFIHAYWDFAIFLNDIQYLKDCSTLDPTNKMLIYTFISTLILTAIYSIAAIYLLRKTKYKEITENYVLTPEDKKKDNNTLYKVIFACLVLNFLPIPTPDTEELNNSEICYTYDTIELEEYDITIQNRKEYIIQEEIKQEFIDDITQETLSTTYNFKIYSEENKIHIKNTNTNYEIKLNIDDIRKYEVIKANDKNLLVIVAIDNIKKEYVVYYTDYLNKNNMNDNNEYLDKLEESFTIIKSLPKIKQTGYINTDNNIYPYIQCEISSFIINEEGKELLIK